MMTSNTMAMQASEEPAAKTEVQHRLSGVSEFFGVRLALLLLATAETTTRLKPARPE
jgi:hypothetical protein